MSKKFRSVQTQHASASETFSKESVKNIERKNEMFSNRNGERKVYLMGSSRCFLFQRERKRETEKPGSSHVPCQS